MLKKISLKKFVLFCSCLFFIFVSIIPSSLSANEDKDKAKIAEIKRLRRDANWDSTWGVIFVVTGYYLYDRALKKEDEVEGSSYAKEKNDNLKSLGIVSICFGFYKMLKGYIKLSEARQLERQLNSQAFLFYQKGKLYVNIPAVGIEHSDSYRIKFPIFAANF